MINNIIKKLIKTANNLDNNKYHIEAEVLTKIAKKLAISYTNEEKIDMLNLPNYKLMEDFEKSPEFIRYQLLVQNDPNFNDNEMLKVLKDKLDNIFMNTDLENYSEEFIENLVQNKFQTTAPGYDSVVELIYDQIVENIAEITEFETYKDRPGPIF